MTLLVRPLTGVQAPTSCLGRKGWGSLSQKTHMAGLGLQTDQEDSAGQEELTDSRRPGCYGSSCIRQEELTDSGVLVLRQLLAGTFHV